MERKRKIESTIEQHTGLIVISLFFVCSLIRFFLISYPRTFYVYNDELRFYQMAENFIHGHGFKVYNSNTSYEKVLYSLLISPAFLLKTRIAQQRLIAIFNCLLICSTVFPSYLLARKMELSKKTQVLTAVVVLSFSEMSYSMTYMSEVLFLPLATWAIYLLYLFINEAEIKRKCRLSIILGPVLYALYMTKEVALVFIVSIIIYYLLENFCVLAKNRRFINKKDFISLLVMVITFALLYLVAKTLFFSRYTNAYYHDRKSIFSSPELFGFTIYAFVYYLINVMFSVLIIPVIAPLLEYKNLDDKSKRFYKLIMLIFVITSAVVTYTTTIQEDFKLDLPRAHMRYICYIWVPFILLLCKCFESVEFEISKSKKL